MTISRSRDGPVYAGTTFELRVDISFTDLTVDIAIDISWKQSNNNITAIGNDNRTTVSSFSGSGDSYSSTLAYSPIAISDSGNITAIVTINLSSSNESSCAEIKVSDTEQLIVEGIITFNHNFQPYYVTKACGGYLLFLPFRSPSSNSDYY